MQDSRELIKKRVYALTTDFFIVVMTNYFLMAAFTDFLKTVFFHLSLRSQLFLIKKLSIMSSSSLLSLTFAYFTLFYFVTNGRTMVKSIFGLKVVANQGEMTLAQAMKRSIAYIICAMFGSFLFALSYLRKDQKSLADLFSNTTVTYESAEQEVETYSQFDLIVLAEMKQKESESKPESNIDSSEDQAA
jgi:uncharacterized RDD family membrane protein YckC